MKYLVTIKPPVIDKIKLLLQHNGIRETARIAGTSYYTAWCVSKGKYDNDQPLQTDRLFGDRCPITGFKKDRQTNCKHKSALL